MLNVGIHLHNTKYYVYIPVASKILYPLFITRQSVLYYREMSVKRYFLCTQYLCEPLIVYNC